MQQFLVQMFKDYYFLNQITNGSFGTIQIIQHKNTKHLSVIKIKYQSQSQNTFLYTQYKCYQKLQQIHGIPKIQKFYTIQLPKQYHKKCCILQMELLGKNLCQIFSEYNVSKPSFMALSIQLLNIIEAIHKRGVIHKDIKPENIICGYNQQQKYIYLVDFGLSYFIESTWKQNHFMGSLKYSSIGSHELKVPCYKDDLESLTYTLIALYGELPWSNIKNQNFFQKEKEIYKMKKEISIQVLTKGLPKSLIQLAKYMYKLSRKQVPDYKYLKELFICDYREFYSDNQYGFEVEKIQEVLNQNKNIKQLINRNSFQKLM